MDANTGEITKQLGWSFGQIGDGSKLGNSKKIKAEFNQAQYKYQKNVDIEALKDFNTMVQEQGMTVEEAISKMTSGSDAARKYAREVGTAGADIDEFTTRQDAANAKLQESQKGFKGLSTSAKALIGNLGATLAIGAAFELGSWAWDKLDEKFTITKQSKLDAMNKTISEFSDKTAEASKNTQTIKSLADEFNTLAKGVNDAGENIGLSSSQFERYNELVSELTTASPELITGYTKEGNAIVDRNNAIADGIKLQQEYAQQATEAYTTNDAMDSIIEGASVGISEAKRNLNKEADSLFSALKDVKTTKVIAGKRGAGATSNRTDTSDLLNEVLGHEVNLEHATFEELGDIVTRRAQIIEKARESNKYSKEELETLQSTLSTMSDYYSDVSAESQPVYENLLAYATKISDDTGESLMSSIPEALQGAFQTGLRELSTQDLDASEMKSQVRQLQQDLTDLYTENGKGDKESLGYRDALDQITQAKKDFDKSAKDKTAIEAYNSAVKKSVKALDSLSEAQEKAGNDTLAKALRQQSLELADYAQDIAASLSEAFNPYQDAFASTKTAKSTFDEWREGITDYADGIASYKEILDSVLTSTETGGNGTMAFWKAAEMTLGDKAVRALNYNVDAAKTKMTELQTAMSDGQTATEYFYTSLADNADKINTVLGRNAVTEDADGIKFDINSSEWAAVADVLGVSEESMMSLLNAAQQFSNIDLSNTDAVRSALAAQETTAQKDGKMFALAEPIEKEAQKALGSVEAAHRRIEELNQEDDISLISLDVLKDNANYSKKYLQDQVDTYAAYQQQAKDVAKTFTEMGYGKIDGDIIKFNDSDIDHVTSSMLQMGASTDDLYATLKAFRDSDDIDMSKKFKGMSDDELKDYTTKLQQDYQDALSEDPTLKMTASVDNLTNSVERLIAAMDGIPDIDIESNIDDIENQIDEFDWKGATQNERGDKGEEIQSNIDSARKNVEALKQGYNNLSKEQQKSSTGKALKKQYEDAEKALDAYEEKLQVLKDSGDLDQAASIDVDSEDAKAKLLELKSELISMDGKTVSATCEAIVENDDKLNSFIASLGSISDEDKEVVVKALTEGAEGDINGFLREISSLPPEIQTNLLTYIQANYTLGSQEQPKDSTAGVNYGTLLGQIAPTPGASSVYYRLGGQDAPENKTATVFYKALNTVKDAMSVVAGGGASGTANRRKQSTFPSMAKGGKIGPTGNGGLTLTGELGTELVWLPDESRSFLVGQYGPEMVNLPSNAVIYPSDETRRIIGDTLSPGRIHFGSMATGGYKRGSSSSYSSGSYSGSSGSSGSGNSSSSSSSSSEESEYEKRKKELDHKLKMEYLSESEYYKKLKELYNRYQSELSKNVDDQRAALEDLHDAWIDAYEAAKDSLDHQLEMGVITEAQYYEKLKSLGDQYYKGRSEYNKEWEKHLEEMNDAAKEAYDAQADELQRQLDKGLITIEIYYKKISELQNKWLKDPGLKNDLKDAQDDLLDALVDGWDQRMSDLSDMIDNFDLVDENFEELKKLYEGLGLNIDDVVTWDETSDLLTMWEKFIEAFESPDVLNMFSKFEGGTKEYYKLLQEFRKEQLEAEKDYYDEITDLIQDTLRWEAEEKIKALEEQIDAYQEIIDKKKKSLSITEDEFSYMDEMTDYAEQIAKLQNEISILNRDTSRSGIAQRKEKEEELAKLLKDQNKTVRDNTLDKTEDMLDDQADKFSEALQKEIDSINDWLDNTSEVLNAVKDAIENRETNNILERMEKYNAIQGDGLFATVKDATDTLNKLLQKYGDNEEALSRITAILSKESNDSKYNTGIQPKTHHSGLKTGFTGDGASLKQNEVYRLLTDDELVLNRADQFRLANQLLIGDSIKNAYSDLLKTSSPTKTGVSPASINLTINAPVTISGNATPEAMKELDKFGEKIGDDVFDRLTDALRLNGISTGAKLNVRKK